MYFNCYLSHFIVSDVSEFLFRRQNRPDILSAGEEVLRSRLVRFMDVFRSNLKNPKIHALSIMRAGSTVGGSLVMQVMAYVF